MSRFKGRPINGLPGQLPPGEKILWQAAPRWQALALRAFRIKLVAVYFVALVAWPHRRRAHGRARHPLRPRFGPLRHLPRCRRHRHLHGLFLLISRSTRYTITEKRVVITYGMALPKSLNLPFAQIQAADLAMQPDGTGNIVLQLPAKTRLSYVLLWPHVKAGEKSRPEPMLRALEAPREAARLLAGLLADSVSEGERAVTLAPAAPAELPAMQGIAA